MRNVIRMALAAVIVGMGLSPVAAQSGAGDGHKNANAKLIKLIPAGYRLITAKEGDLNKDGLDDAVLIIEKTRDETSSGIIIAFNKGERYEVALENRDFFSYDSDDIGKHGPDGINIAIKKGILIIEKAGQANCCTIETNVFKFRYQKAEFDWIGYDMTSSLIHNGVISNARSVNFLSMKRQTKINKNQDTEYEDVAVHGKEVFDEEWEDLIIKKKPVTLREIKNFRDFYAWDYMDY